MLVYNFVISIVFKDNTEISRVSVDGSLSMFVRVYPSCVV